MTNVTTLPTAPKTGNGFGGEITSLLDGAINTADKSNNLSAKLSVALWNAANTQELNSVKLLGYAGAGWSKTAKGEYVNTLAVTYSATYREATDMQEAAKSESREWKKREMRDIAKRRITAAETMLRRSVMIAAWFHYVKPTGLTVKLNGCIRLAHDDVTVDGEYTMRSLEDISRKHFRPDATSNRKGSTAGTQNASGTLTPGTAGVSLKTMAEYVSNQVAGKEPGSLGKDLDATLQTCLATLLGYCGAVTAKGLDLKAVDKLYKAAAA